MGKGPFQWRQTGESHVALMHGRFAALVAFDAEDDDWMIVFVDDPTMAYALEAANVDQARERAEVHILKRALEKAAPNN